jgi:hypothetical protein
VFVHVEESSHDEELRREQTYCTECKEYAWIRLVERVRTVTVYWALKSSERHYFLICDHCRAEFRIRERKLANIERSDITGLLRKAGSRYVPFSTRALIGLAVLASPIPLFGPILAWAAWRDSKKVGGGVAVFAKRVFYFALALNAALFLTLAVQDLMNSSEY